MSRWLLRDEQQGRSMLKNPEPEPFWPFPEISHLPEFTRIELSRTARMRVDGSFDLTTSIANIVALLATFFLFPACFCGLFIGRKALFWVIAFVFAGIASILRRRQLVRRALQGLLLEVNIRPACCFRCRYDLRNSISDACPECGEVIGRLAAQG